MLVAQCRPGSAHPQCIVGAFSFLPNFDKEQIVQQADINRAVARITNESIATIKRYGFSIEEPPEDTKSIQAVDETSRELVTQRAARDLALC